jgi:hypothetical protein
MLQKKVINRKFKKILGGYAKSNQIRKLFLIKFITSKLHL